MLVIDFETIREGPHFVIDLLVLDFFIHGIEFQRLYIYFVGYNL